MLSSGNPLLVEPRPLMAGLEPLMIDPQSEHLSVKWALELFL